MEREYIYRIKSVSELELIRQVVFHTFAGKAIDVIIKAYPDSGIVSKYPLFAYDVIQSFIKGADCSNLKIDADVAMSALIDLLNKVPENINPLAEKLEEIYETWQHTLCVLLHASVLATETDIPHAVGLIGSLNFDESAQTYSSDMLEIIISNMYVCVDDFFRQEEDLSIYGRELSDGPYWVLSEAHLWGGNKNSDRSIETQLSIRATEYVPSKPNSYYKDKIHKILKRAGELLLNDDDLLALDWCVKDWSGLADHYLKKGKGKLAIFILEALLYEYESAFKQPHMAVILDGEDDLIADLKIDLNKVLDMYLANLGYYSSKDLVLAFKRFKRLENDKSILSFVDVPTILEALTTH